MKNILITGKKSYIGTSLENWLLEESNRYRIDTVNLRNESWREMDFSIYDVIIHVAGIAHVSSNPKMKDSYYKINRDLAIETAKKAKAEGVKQFIFLSSIIIYGDSSNKTKSINKNTVPTPSNFYGDSKFQAEIGINQLISNDFKVVVLRLPMIYGKGSRGNYTKLSKVAKKLPLFPDIDNQRSMLHIDNLCEFIKLMIENEECGLFFPQNNEYVKTSEMVKIIAEVNGRKILLTKVFNPILKLMFKIKIVNKVFGNLFYEMSMSEYDKGNYRIRDFRKSIELTEK